MPPTSPRFRAHPGPLPPAPDARWFAFRGNDLLVRVLPEGGPHGYEVPVAADASALPAPPVRTQPLGWIDGIPCHSVELPEDAPEREGHAYVSLRRLYGRADAAVFEAAGTAYQVQYWDRTHQFCSVCAAQLTLAEGERSKRCPRCAHQFFPKVTPATIVLVEDGPRILMTRAPRFPPGMYGLVAGFVESGESLEACVAREVAEETGISISDITYFGSQPWPFPHQVMVGFVARYAGGAIVVNKDELEEAAWFHRDALPNLPPPLSIARQLVDAWLSRHAKP
ncbi:NAD(+) diphosphatase [Polyangium aurulentum]|uniref:NAD(+) diphosphatase n=1 Tax=Polyangium aurulentum TaxID=2567896 RepID=UPI0010ADC457|nr:NAD(+) diphosphatase [Polyangium aurulentum]UQA63366.1 NAD(+) diphosphatase [Polyangium aurulentum]